MSSTIKVGNIKLKRAYDAPSDDDGIRILIDRLWPRGVAKEAAALDQWLKEIAPSTELRKWFGHDPARWPEFQHRYTEELHQHSEQIKQLRELARQGVITLVFSARDEVHNDTVVLRNFLLGRSRKPSKKPTTAST